jgi:protoporphyrinogen oxidase
LGGIYATPAENLHFKSVFNDVSHIAQFDSYWAFAKYMFKFHKAKPRLEVSGSVSFDGGMQTLIDRLAEELKSEIKLNYKEDFRIKGNTIICTDAYNAAELLKDARPELSAELGRIRYQEISSVTVFLKREIRSLHRSFGVLIPLNHQFNSIGIINNKAVFPSNNENIYSYTLIVPKKCSDDEVISDIKLLAHEFDPEDIEHIENTYWERALPIYDLQRYLAVKKMHQLDTKNQNLAIFGNYVAGISLREMISAARTFVKNPQSTSEIK